MMHHDVTLIDLTYLLIDVESAMIWRAGQANLSGESNSQTVMGTGNIGSLERTKSVIVRCVVPKESICFYCQEKGHWRRSCPIYLRDLRDGRVETYGSNIGKIHLLTLLSFYSRFLIHNVIRLQLMFCRIEEKKGSLREEVSRI